MRALAAVKLREDGAPEVLVAYAEYVQGLAIGPDAKRIRRNAARRLLATHQDLQTWMARPTAARSADLDRSDAWPFLTWCFVEEHLVPDLDLLLAKTPGDLYAAWAQRHPDDVARVTEVARRFGWSSNWTSDVTRGGLALMCLWARKDLCSLNDADFDAFAAELSASPSAGRDARIHNQARLYSLHQACYELRICQRPPRKAMRRGATPAELLEAIPQLEIRRVALRYLQIVATTLRPSTVVLRARVGVQGDSGGPALVLRGSGHLGLGGATIEAAAVRR